jgi:hypothetical protein
MLIDFLMSPLSAGVFAYGELGSRFAELAEHFPLHIKGGPFHYFFRKDFPHETPPVFEEDLKLLAIGE